MIVVTEHDFLDTYKYKVFGLRALEKCEKWFPIYSSPVLSRIVGSIFTDGHLQVRNVDRTKKYEYCGLFAKNKNELERFSDDINSMFGVKATIRDWGKGDFGSSLGCIVSNSAVVRVLRLCGVPSGDKVIEEFNIPTWIIDSSKTTKIHFLRRMFSCDGSIVLNKNCKRWEVRFYSHKAKFILESGVDYLNSIKNMLNEFKIKSTEVFQKKSYIRNKDKKEIIPLEFKVFKPKSILNFKKYIGFDVTRKQNLLIKAETWAVDKGRYI